MNVVFDLGGVVVRWDPDALAAGAFDDPGQQALARREILGHRDWLELDRGSLTPDQVIARGVARTGLPESRVADLLAAVPPSLTVIPETSALLRRLHARGIPLYCLSNIGAPSMEHIERAHDFWDVFSGRVFSCRVGACKPEPGIYAYLLDTYGLDPRRTVLIDDVEANVRGAERAGMRGLLFRGVMECERELLGMFEGRGSE